MNVAASFIVIGVLFCTGESFEFKCAKNDDGSMTILSWLTKSPAAVQLQAIDTTNNFATDGCKSTETDGVLYLSITVDCATLAQSVPAPELSCFVTKTGDNLGVSIAQQQYADVITTADLQYDLSCDCTASTSAQSATAVDLTGITLTPGTSTARTADAVVAELYDDDSTPTPLAGPQTLGTKFTIRVTYTPDPAGTAGEYPQALLIYNVIVSGTATFDKSVQLITDNGCMNKSTAAKAFNLEDSFTFVSASPTISESGLMDVAAFPGSASLYIKVYYKAVCLTTTDPRCADQQAYCDGNGLVRKRRSADDTSAINGSLTLSVPVSYIGGVQSKILTQQSKNQPECRVPDLYWIISMVLGIMLLIVMIISVFLALRLRREVRNADKFEGKENLSYR